MPLTRKPRKRFSGDLVVFLAVLSAVIVLVLLGHCTPQQTAGYTTAATALYAAWSPRPPQDGGPRGHD
ncbi:hypothetical protein [Streptacidiphilus sp. P02-A3a]|uniref:hypothetical protein n=1 Tax=Streptacidiphilus sp. P02-A3a TaxID=2704468 RepID=UPI0015FA4576|nr:hypothetical protein [Streptacidiphilus sp. P02-A3a]QMU69617.1 hypothetical protein GXP74_16595 [Streptacidiphilus sp. P02-A3a]